MTHSSTTHFGRSAAWVRALIALVVLLLPFAAHSAAAPKKVLFVSGEYEYFSRESLPPFIAELEKKHPHLKTTLLLRPEDKNIQSIPGLVEALKEADLVVLYIRRMTLPENEIAAVRAYVESGRPLVGLRTASHSFENWKAFDKDVLGGNYGNHFGNTLKPVITIAPENKAHPILRGVTGFTSSGSLYRNLPLGTNTVPLLMGTIEKEPPHPVAWVRTLGKQRIFYTSLGHVDDFKEESFRTLVRQGILWALQVE